MKTTLVFCILCTFVMLNEYKKTGMRDLKAKVLHFISVIFLIIINADSLIRVGGLVNNNAKVRELLGENLSPAFGEINYYNSIILATMSFILLIFSVGLMSKNEEARRIVVNLILYFIPFYIVQFYMTITQRNLGSGVVIVLVGFIFGLILYGSIYKIFKSKLMIEFFKKT